MNKEQTFQQFLTAQSVQVDIYNYIINLFITVLLAYILQRLFVKYSNTKSNKGYFANNFVLLALTTMLIITIVKSSLALSLGLIGALSIVRFRAPIKEPEELVYLFLTIGIGLGMGANQKVVTIIALSIIVMFVVIKNINKKRSVDRGLFMTISSKNSLDFDLVNEALNKYCTSIVLQRYDSSITRTEMCFIVEFNDHSCIAKCRTHLGLLDNSLSVSMLDYQGYYAA